MATNVSENFTFSTFSAITTHPSISDVVTVVPNTTENVSLPEKCAIFGGDTSKCVSLFKFELLYNVHFCFMGVPIHAQVQLFSSFSTIPTGH